MGSSQATKIGVAQFDWRDPYHLAVGLSWWQFILGALGLDLLLNLTFGALYAWQPGSVANVRPGSYADAVFFSIETLATVGYGVMAPHTLYGHIVSSIEIVVGMGFTAVTTGLLFVRISRPRPRLLFARTVVVARHNGRPSLMVRVANERAAALTNASAELTVLLPERTTEGQLFRRIFTLRLERERLPIFALTWTLIHVLDENSPLAGYDAERMVRDQARLFLSVEARDPVLAATVHVMRDYLAENVVFGQRYVDAVVIDDDGHVTADLRRIHDMEDEPEEFGNVKGDPS